MTHPDFPGLKPLPADSVLGRIIARKITDVRERIRSAPTSTFERTLEPSDRSILEALAGKRASVPALIAEVKRRSPSRGALSVSLAIDVITRFYERHASAISVVCDEPFFGGNLALLREVRSQVTRPVLLKDFIISEYQVIEGRAHGADAVLLMLSVLEPHMIERFMFIARAYRMEALVETHTEEELEAALSTSARIVGINNRDLHTLQIDPERFHRLAPRIGGGRIAVAESGIRSRMDIERLKGIADAVLIGGALMEAPDVEARIRELGFS